VVTDNYGIKKAGSWKGRVFLFVRLAVSFGLIGYIVYQIAKEHDLSSFPLYYEKAHWGWLMLAVAAVFSIFCCGALRWGILLRAQGVSLSGASIFMYFMVGMFYNNFLPSTVGGDAVKVYYLHRFSGKGKEAFVSVLVDRLLGMAGLCIVAVVSLAFGWRTILEHPGISGDAWMIFGTVGGLTAFLIVFFLVVFNDRLMNVFFRLVPVASIKEKIRGIHDALLVYRGRRSVLIKALGVSVLVWICIVFACWMVYRGFAATGMPVPRGQIGEIGLKYFYLFFPTISAIMSVPISVAGGGVREGLFMLFFGKGSFPGVTEMDAVMISLNFYFIFLAASSIGGVIYGFKDQLRFHRELPSEQEQPKENLP